MAATTGDLLTHHSLKESDVSPARIPDEKIIGKRSERLEVIGIWTENGRRRCLCRCDCGNTHTTDYQSVRTCHTRSCGCLNIESRTTHGGCKEQLHSVWGGMLHRCRSSRRREYKNYGGRGISVCLEWEDYAVFRIWALANGYEPGLEIDRRENDKDYCPDNCRFVTHKENNRNTRRNVYLTMNGQTLAAAEWAEKLGIRSGVIRWRKHQGWSDEESLTTPSRRGNRRSIFSVSEPL